MKSLLNRQINKLIKTNPEVLQSLQPFFNAVNESYGNYEDQLSMLQRAMKISSDELFEANKKLREEANSLKEVNENLSNILKSINLDATKLADEKEFNQTEYLKKQAEEIILMTNQREELLKNLETQNQELNEYAHVVSHDLKAPLRNIDTLINWVIEDNKERMGENCLNSLNLVLSNVEKMDLLIKGILDYSTIDKLESEDRWLNINHIIEEVLRIMNIPKNVNFKIQENLPKLYGNAWRFKQVFQNLIQNAIKYSDKEEIIIEIGSKENKDSFEFFVKDNGIGIAENYFHKIFNVFTKLQSNTPSSGIGLSIVKKIVNYYDGEIWLESQEGLGSTFFFTISK
ncbi:Two-component sensor histidine kinase [Flavobacterium sp. 9AF]|uniref:sensor histidine kinase n=1 Tax=Flavobacterium sp. 9AF TaxID=2653142 RepID=UPI0012F3DC80|nr:ATP-binding protein [Flavobacterium sp. 9AF]VXB21714.1 Two-component sensor histidine kinase [Flavobacterium sp. 9AF]